MFFYKQPTINKYFIILTHVYNNTIVMQTKWASIIECWATQLYVSTFLIGLNCERYKE